MNTEIYFQRIALLRIKLKKQSAIHLTGV